MNETVSGVVNELLISLLCAVISAAAGYAMLLIHKAKAKLQTEIDKIQSEKERQLLCDSLDELERLATVTVTAAEQTIAKDLREAVKKGGKSVTANKEQLSMLASVTAAKIYTGLKPEYLSCLDKNVSNLQDYIKDLIESKVYEVKNNATPP